MSRRGVLLTALWPLPVFCVLGLALLGGHLGGLLTALWPLPVFCVLGLALFGGERARAPLPVFLDTTAKAGITFQLLSSRTPQKSLIESMPGRVAMLDYDGDGFEDLFFVNGARLQNPMPPGAAPD